MKIKREAHRNGTQTIERAISLLREVSVQGHGGSQLSDLAAQCRLRKSTAHRILTCLVNERLIKQRSGDRRYVLGPMLFELGLSSHPERGEFQHAARTRLADLAKRTSGVAFLFFRSGDDFVCAARMGAARCGAKALAVFTGTRRPLVLAAGGAAILVALPEEEASATIQRNLATLSGYTGASAQGVRHMMERSFAEGIAINAGDIFPGVNAFGLALRDRSGVPFASIALAGPAQTLPLEQLGEIRALMEQTARGLQAAPAMA